MAYKIRATASGREILHGASLSIGGLKRALSLINEYHGLLTIDIRIESTGLERPQNLIQYIPVVDYFTDAEKEINREAFLISRDGDPSESPSSRTSEAFNGRSMEEKYRDYDDPCEEDEDDEEDEEEEEDEY